MCMGQANTNIPLQFIQNGVCDSVFLLLGLIWDSYVWKFYILLSPQEKGRCYTYFIIFPKFLGLLKSCEVWDFCISHHCSNCQRESIFLFSQATQAPPLHIHTLWLPTWDRKSYPLKTLTLVMGRILTNMEAQKAQSFTLISITCP